jgi:hypothetical protein
MLARIDVFLFPWNFLLRRHNLLVEEFPFFGVRGEREKNQFCDPIMSITFIVCEKCRFFSENSNAAVEIFIWYLQRGVSKEVMVKLPVGLRGCVA